MMRLVLLLSAFCAITYGCPKIIPRSSWLASKPKCSSKLQTPVQYVFIHHTAGIGCAGDMLCRVRVKGIQVMHMVKNGWCDIGYSFLVAPNGNIYEGVGWNTVGAHTKGYNSRGYGISFIGTYTNNNPTAAAQNAAKQLIACGVRRNLIKSNYVLKGHRNVGDTECPGNAFYKTITRWPHFRAGKN
ncbi:peptidoglycan recognition protein 1-like [Rhinophrynus dorsalis]